MTRKDYKRRERRNEALDKAKAEWGYDQKLKASGFFDIENNDWELRSKPEPGNPTRSAVSLSSASPMGAVNSELDISLDDRLDGHHPVFRFNDSYTSRYYHHAAHLADLSFKAGVDDRVSYIRLLHSQGVSQRDIMRLAWEEWGYDWTRAYVRKHVERFADLIKKQIDFSQIP